ncbi:MAG: beta-galactosidase [Planctomycetota bacterium]|jgi:beta-galactosidase
MIIGVAYYPEHWPEERWPADARLMKETGIDVVRVGEFAWSRLEPRRGQYDMDWLERAVEVLAAEGLKVILGTPTATPPQWLFIRHPNMVPQDREGGPWFRGSRRHICLNNRPYRRYVRRIVREVAKVFANKPELFAWQIDNELGCHDSGRCYCDDCEQAFREWLKRRYGVIDRLNSLWGTVFWSQKFNDWHEVPAPRRTPADPHPSLALDYQRFMAATFRSFVAEQREIIEQYSEDVKPITTNSLGLWLDQVDLFSLGVPQDVASLDNYPIGAGGPDGPALALDLTRCVKRKPFWVMEQQAGATMLAAPRGQPRAGQLRLWSYQAAARGAELICYFRWRTCAFGQEMHWYGMLDANGSLPRRYEEIKGTIDELKEKGAVWHGKLPDARVAIVLDYHSHWALQADSMNAEIDYLEQFGIFYGLLRRSGCTADIIPVDRDLAGYDLVIAPMPMIGREQQALAWKAFVERGGALIVTAPAGYRTEQNTWPASPPPGPMAELLGIQVLEHDMLGKDVAVTVAFEGATFPVRAFCSVLAPQDAETLAAYGEEYYAGQAAVTRRSMGEGCAYFLGAIGGADLYEHLLGIALRGAGIEPHPWSSDLVEVVPLQAGEDEEPLTFVLNHSGEAAELSLPDGEARRDLLMGHEHSGKVTLAGYGVVLLQG